MVIGPARGDRRHPDDSWSAGALMNPQQHSDTASREPQDSQERLWRLADNPAEPSASTAGPDFESLRQLLGLRVCRRLGIYELPAGFLLSVVVPIFNERRTIEEVIRRIRATGLPVEMILVDDGSVDGTRDLLATWREQPDMRIIFHDINQGKGSALRTGFAAATGDVVIVQDADLEYDPAEFAKLIQPIVENQADVVFGSRFSGDNQRVLYFWHYVGNRVLTLLSNMMTNLNLTDMETCYKAFRREVIQKIGPTLREQRFGIEPELTAKLARLPKIRIHERPISYAGRTYAEGKKITWRDGFRALYCIIRYSRGIQG
jgi:glycosyltransferase involved in cell wall biosynthesis